MPKQKLISDPGGGSGPTLGQNILPVQAVFQHGTCPRGCHPTGAQSVAVRCVRSIESLETRFWRFREPTEEDFGVMLYTEIKRPLTGQQDRPKDSTAHPSGSGLRILLAEGDTGNAECMALLLQIWGHQVQIAQSGPAALHMAQADLPDVVILEIRLPGMDGWEIARRLQSKPTGKRPFCIAVTSCITEVDRFRSKEAGIDLHLAKPLKPGYLRKILRRFQAIIKPAERF